MRITEMVVSTADKKLEPQILPRVTAAPFESAMDAHLHLEATEDGVPFNPENLFG